MKIIYQYVKTLRNSRERERIKRVMINLSFYYAFDLQDVEKELELQISMKQEMEMALRILEKDIHEKQDTMISLRQQLEEIKGINLEMYQKLQVDPAVFIYTHFSIYK